MEHLALTDIVTCGQSFLLFFIFDRSWCPKSRVDYEVIRVVDFEVIRADDIEVIRTNEFKVNRAKN